MGEGEHTKVERKGEGGYTYYIRGTT